MPSASWPQVDGVTVLIHDQECAAELRRKRKRGKAADAGRADLDQRARLRGLRRLRQEVELPVGPARGDRVRPQDPDPPGLVQQGLLVRRGRLPVVPDGRARQGGPRGGAARRRPLPEPEPVVSDADCGVRMMGVGGTGVVTVSQVLGMAALIDGLDVRGLDQTGLSQKGGPVVSDLRISRAPLASRQQGSGGQRRRCTSASTCSAPAATRTSPAPRPTAPSPWCRPARCRPAAWSPTRRAVPRAGRPLGRVERATRAETTSTWTPRRSPSACSATT